MAKVLKEINVFTAVAVGQKLASALNKDSFILLQLLNQRGDDAEGL